MRRPLRIKNLSLVVLITKENINHRSHSCRAVTPGALFTTMPLRQDVLEAFSALGLTPDVDIEEATKVYRRLALQHHPDRNHGDSTATQRFQQVL